MPEKVDDLETQLLVVDPLSDGGGTYFFQYAPVRNPVEVWTEDIVWAFDSGSTVIA